MLHMTKRTFAVMRCSMWVGCELFGLFNKWRFRVAFHARCFIRIFDVIHIFSVANSTSNTFGNMAIGSERTLVLCVDGSTEKSETNRSDQVSL